MPLASRVVRLAVLCALLPAASFGAVRYVDVTAGGANTGANWADAFTSLSLALAAASSGDEIWVAGGTYRPTATTDRTASFALKNGVVLYGGFDGTEILQSDRDPLANATVLSGDIGSTGVSTDNSYHVVSADGTVTDSAVLDGFTITGGRADGAAAPDNRGGGLHGPTYVPPDCVTPTFGDVPCSSPFARWVEELVDRNITAGCGAAATVRARPSLEGRWQSS